MGCLRLLLLSAVTWGIILGGCAYTPKYLDNLPANAHVYQHEYVLRPSDGPFQEWPKKGLAPVLPKGTPTAYITRSTGKEVLYKALEADATTYSLSETITPYSKEHDACVTQELPNCEPNWVLSIDKDPLEDSLWGIQNPPGVNIYQASIQEAPDVKVMVLDTGVNCGHEDIRCNNQLNYNAITDSSEIGDAMDDNGHGSHVSGTIGAVGGNQKGIRGVSRISEIVPGKFLGSGGNGSLFNAIKAIRWATEKGVDIINCSFGGGGYSEAFQNAINDATEAGILIIAAAGNSNNDNDKYPHYPSNYANVLSVASHTSAGNRSRFSNYGKDSVHVSAPGSDILSVLYTGGYNRLSGTSMATPHVAGLAALIYQKYKDRPKQERRLLALQKIQETATPVSYVKYGQISYKALEDTSCNHEKCKNCLRNCPDENCKKWRKCRIACREDNNCGVKCQ